MGRADGISDAELDALGNFRDSSLFGERERAALEYAQAITKDATVEEELFERVRRHFEEDAIVELTATITFEICAAKFNRALEIEAQGVCRVARAVEG